MFILEETSIAKATQRARELHPIVRIIGFGKYTVTGSQPGSLYTVTCGRDQYGQKVVNCTCKTRDGIACKHGMAAVALHIYMATVKALFERSVRRAAWQVR